MRGLCLCDAAAITAFGEGISTDDVRNEQTDAYLLIKYFTDFLLRIFITFTFRSLACICKRQSLSIIPATCTNCNRNVIKKAPPDVESRSPLFELSIATAALGSVEPRARDYSSD